jgi:murein DD-endopeptidase MepM/ murein hydrolase activator NlpD
MQNAAFWSGLVRFRLVRGVSGIIAASLLLGLSGCSSGVSRFDFPSFNLTRSSSGSSGSTAAYAGGDPATTASLPVPEESVYASGGSDNYGSSSNRSQSVARADLPPPPQASYTPRATPASYSPAPRAYAQPQKVSYSAGAPVRPQPAVIRASAPAGSPRTVTVAKGDSLGGLAKRYGVSMEALQAANNLSGTHLDVGQQLIIPTPGATIEAKTYKVQKGDTPHIIAEKLGVDEKALIARNKLRAAKLQIGQMLIVPGAGGSPGQSASLAPSVVASVSKPSSETPAPKASPGVRVVHTTTIPAAGGEGAPHGSTAATASPEVTGGAPAKEPGQSAQIASVDQLPTPEPMSGNSFRWPVQGRIIGVFGTKPDGGHNDGINVAVPQGTSVKAAENGVVAYAGNELKGYGNLVLIRHSNNWVSAYAHNEEILVKRGDKVRRGQIIAKAGNTGSVSQPQVHFELRKGSRPVDPTKYMSETSASAD